MNDTMSLPCQVLVLSRRISVAMRDSIAVSQFLNETYTWSSSKAIQTSVRSVAGAPACGSIWRNPEIGATSRYKPSSSAPSMRSGWLTRTARTVARPSASRVITLGAVGSAGASAYGLTDCAAAGEAAAQSAATVQSHTVIRTPATVFPLLLTGLGGCAYPISAGECDRVRARSRLTQRDGSIAQG